MFIRTAFALMHLWGGELILNGVLLTLLLTLLSLQLESFKNFDFDHWRQRYVAWIRSKKLRITDFFRRQDKNGFGTLTRDQFVSGMLISSEWPSFSFFHRIVAD